MIDTKCSLNSINSILTRVSILILIMILIGTILYFIYIKKNRLFEQYENVAVTREPISSYTQDEQGGESRCTFPKFKYPENMNFRDCQIYFTSNIDKCDSDKSSDPHNTCKYVFNGWKEFDSTTNENGQQIHYPKKIYNRDYTNDVDIINGPLVNKCFMPFSLNSAKSFEYENNELVNHDCTGKFGRTDYDTNLFNNDKYTSFNFLNNTIPSTNYNNAVSSICSVRYAPLTGLNNKKFYKFELNAQNQIQDIKKCSFNSEQNGLIVDNTFSLNTFLTNNTAYGLEYKEEKDGQKIFNIFQVNSYPPRTVNVYTFKYNYLCTNSQITSFDIRQKQIQVNNFINTPTITNKTISLNIDNTLDWSIYSNEDNNQEDKRQIIINDLNSKINIINTNIDNSYLNRIEQHTQNITTNRTLHTAAIKNMNDYKPSSINDVITNVNKIFVPNTNRSFLNLGIQRGVISQSNDFSNSDNSLLNESIVYNGRGNLKKGLMMWKINGYFDDVTDKITANVNTNNILNFIHGVTEFNNITSATTNNIDQTGSLGQPINAQDTYSMMWKGIFYAHNAGLYRFLTISDDASYVILNNSVIVNVNNGGLHGMQESQSAPIQLDANSLNEIIIYFGENYGDDNLVFAWKYEYSDWNYNGSFNNKNYLWHFCGDCQKCNNNCNDSATTMNISNKNLNPIHKNGFYYYELIDPNVDYTLNIKEKIDNCEVLVVGGGGSGGIRHGGGGGAGALMYSKSVSFEAGSYTLKVGKGGTPKINSKSIYDTRNHGNNGENSYIKKNKDNTFLFNAPGGGGGSGAGRAGLSGGSSGGSSGGYTRVSNEPKKANNNNVYGTIGGSGSPSGPEKAWAGGGGGGAGGLGGNATKNRYNTNNAGNGGPGKMINITGTNKHYAAGGGGGCHSGNPGMGGSDIGGNGTKDTNIAKSGKNNTGSGGGGSGFNGEWNGIPGAGGSGIIILKFNNNSFITENLFKQKSSEININTVIDLYKSSTISSPYSIKEHNYIDPYNLTLIGNKINSINICSYIYLQKGYYIFYAHLTNQNSYFKSVLSINNNNTNNFHIVHILKGINNAPMSYEEYQTKNHIEITKGGFYKMLFQYVGENNSTMNIESQFKVYVSYKSRPLQISTIAISSLNVLNNGSNLNNYLKVIKKTLDYINLTDMSEYLYYGFDTSSEVYDIFSDIKNRNNDNTSLDIFKNYIHTYYDFFRIKEYTQIININEIALINIDNEKNNKKNNDDGIINITSIINQFKNIDMQSHFPSGSQPGLNNVDISNIFTPVENANTRTQMITMEKIQDDKINKNDNTLFGNVSQYAAKSLYIEEF